MIYYFKFIIVFITTILFLCLENVNSQSPLSQAEYECLDELITKMGSVGNTPKVGGYYIYCMSSDPLISITCEDSLNSVTSLTITQTTTTQLESTDFSCFTNLRSAKLKNPTLINNFFSTWPVSGAVITIDTIQNPNSLIFSPFSPNINNALTLRMYQQTTPTVIPFSYLKGITGSNAMYTATTNEYSVLSSTSHDIKYTNDLSSLWTINIIEIVSKNVPLLTNVRANGLSITLVPGFDRQSLVDNIPSIGQISSFTLISSIETIPFPTSINQVNPSTSFLFSILTIDGKLETPSSIIDLSKINSLGTIKILNVGGDFSINQNVPIKFPEGKSIEFSGGKINTFDISLFNDPYRLNVRNNTMGGTLPLNKPTNLYSLEIQDNQMTGTIDSSYCTLSMFSFKNNQFIGKIPSCFTCYFNTIYGDFGKSDFFSGNNFDTPQTTCTTIIPNLIYTGDRGEHYFEIHGQDLGFDSMAQYIETGIVGSTLIVSKESSMISLSFPSDGVSPPKIITITYTLFNPPQVFTLAWDPLKPQFETVTWSNEFNLQFDGSYFSYNKSNVSITVGGKDCIIASANFNQIICSLSDKVAQGSKTLLTYVTVGKLTTQITLNPNTVNTILNCTAQFNDCNGGGYCNSELGTCICDSNHQGEACDIPFIQCPSTLNGVCNNQGSCSTQVGQCICNGQYQGIVCDYIECIDPLCSSNGQCNHTIGTCICATYPNGWSGSICTIPLQTMSSVNASSTEGGEAVFYGWFGKVHSEPSLSIGGKDCKITSITETVLICTAPAGNGVQTVIFTQNLYTYTINNFYEYKTIGKSCPNDCTSNINGKCNSMTGYCQCIGNWGGYDCSLYRNDNTGSGSTDFPALPTNITINGTNGNTNLNNQQTNYEISITSLIEFDLSGNQIKNYPLLNNWSVKTENIKSDIYQFIQTIQGGCNITFILEDIKVTRNISFAGLEFQLESGSVKMTIIIDNYQYSSNLNTLQLQMKSTVSEIKSNDSNECNNENIEINTIGDYDNSLNYLSIKKNAKVLSGRFLNRVESDGKSTYSQTTVVSKSNETVVIGMNLPHFKQSIKIDPDFSVLISPEFKSECEDDSNRKWVIPVAVCVSVVGAAAVIAAGLLMYRKHTFEKPFLLKMKNLKIYNKN